MMNHTPAPVMTASRVMVQHEMTSMSVFQLIPVTPMLPVPTATVHKAVHVKVVTPVTVLPELTMINVHSECTRDVHSRNNKGSICTRNAGWEGTRENHTEPVPISMFPTNVIVRLDMLVTASLNPS